jgi:hypothetical protein
MGFVVRSVHHERADNSRREEHMVIGAFTVVFRRKHCVRFAQSCLAVLLSNALVPILHAQDAALVFDGVDDIATVPSTNEWPILTSNLTVEAWINPSDLSRHEIIAIVWGGDRFALQQSHSDTSVLVWTISRGPTDSAYSPTGSMVEGRWDHFAGTYDGTTMRLYRNGNLIAEEVHISPGDVVVRGDLLLAIRPTAPTFAGSIDEVRVWLSVRTEEQIRRWFDRPITGTEPDLIGWWRFGEGAGQVFSDSSQIANNGFLGNTAAVEPEDPQWTGLAAPLAFFFDGFESGGTGAWSVTVP